MNRRKGVPCGCGADPCGCSPRNHCVKAINNVSPDPNGDFGIAAGENVTISETEYGIEISATGGSAEDAVKSVNGELPDQDGDVTVDTGVMTVNGVSADADGEVTITAGSNITITPDADTNSIEISANVPVIATSDPLYINSNGEIDIKDWDYVPAPDWITDTIDASGNTIEDFIIICNYTNNKEFFYIPKGIPRIGMILVTHYNRNSTSYMLAEGVFNVGSTVTTYIYPLWSYQDTATTTVEGFTAIKTGYGYNNQSLYKRATYVTNQNTIALLRRRKTE